MKLGNWRKIRDAIEAGAINYEAIWPANWWVDLRTIVIFNRIRAAGAADKNRGLVDEVTGDNLDDWNSVILIFFLNLDSFKYLR